MKTPQRAERNVENPSRPRCRVLNNNGFRLSGHFYIILPATLIALVMNSASYKRCVSDCAVRRCGSLALTVIVIQMTMSLPIL
jgi:hypothetical protein